jgi:hypothetical protein
MRSTVHASLLSASATLFLDARVEQISLASAMRHAPRPCCPDRHGSGPTDYTLLDAVVAILYTLADDEVILVRSAVLPEKE